MKVRTGGALMALVACSATIIACQPAAAQNKPAPDPNAPIASVNGEKIPLNEWIGRMQMLRAANFIQSTNPLKFKNATAGQVALEEIVNTRLLLQYAKENKLLPGDAELKKQLTTLKTDPAVAASLTDHRVTEDQLLTDLRISRTLYRVATSGVEISPAEVQAFYDKNKNRLWGTPDLYELALLRTSKSEDADKALAELKKGATFASVVSKYSEDQDSKKAGGVIGTSTLDDPGLPYFLRGPIAALKPGQNTSVIKATFPGASSADYFIAHMVKKVPATARPFNDVKAEVNELALINKVGGIEVANRKIETYRKKAKIEVYMPAYQALFK